MKEGNYRANDKGIYEEVQEGVSWAVLHRHTEWVGSGPHLPACENLLPAEFRPDHASHGGRQW